MEHGIAGLVLVVTVLVLALWRLAQRVATLEGFTGTAFQRAMATLLTLLSPRGQGLLIQLVLLGAFLGMAAGAGLALAFVPLLLAVGGRISMTWPAGIFFGGTGLYIAVSVGAHLYYRVIRGTPAPWEGSQHEQEDQ